MILTIQGQEAEVEYIRVHRDALRVRFYALVEREWTRMYKFDNPALPTYQEVEWDNPLHKFGWSKPYRL